MDRSSSDYSLDRGTGAAVKALEDQLPRTNFELPTRTNFQPGRAPRCLDSTPLLKLEEERARKKIKSSAAKGGEAKILPAQAQKV